MTNLQSSNSSILQIWIEGWCNEILYKLLRYCNYWMQQTFSIHFMTCIIFTSASASVSCRLTDALLQSHMTWTNKLQPRYYESFCYYMNLVTLRIIVDPIFRRCCLHWGPINTNHDNIVNVGLIMSLQAERVTEFNWCNLIQQSPQPPVVATENGREIGVYISRQLHDKAASTAVQCACI